MSQFLPPSTFQVEIQRENSHQKATCRLCKVKRRKFICKACIKSGIFFRNGANHDRNNDSERFIDKQQKLKNLKNAQKLLEDKFNAKFEKLTRLENLQSSILRAKSRNSILTALIKEKRENILKLSETKKENHDKNRAQRIILPRYEDKVNKLGDFVLEAEEKNDNLRKKSQDQMEELQKLRRSFIEKLVKFIFPISHQIVKSSTSLHSLAQSSKASNESLRDAMNEIAEAMLTTAIEKEFVIVAPTLPSHGNYQEYCDWIHTSRDGSTNSGMAAAAASEACQVKANHAYRIAAGLTYIAQLLQAVSFYLDVRLPHKVTYNDFCTMGLNEQQFRKKVARLNLNLVYLCYTQNLSMKQIQPARTMENIFMLLDIRNVSFGRTGPVLDTSQRSVDSIMQSFTDILDDEHSDTDDDDSDDTTLQKEWENVGNLPMVDITHSTMIPQQTASMAGTIMNNVAHSLSFWKWK